MNEETLKGACLTAPGEGGVAIFRVIGEDVSGLLSRIFRSSAAPGSSAASATPAHSLRFGHLMDGDQLVDEVVVHQARDGLTAEISTHGGGSTRQRVESLLERAGVTRVDCKELLRTGGPGDSRIEEEAHLGLSEAWSLQGVLFFLSALRGDLTRAVGGLRAALEAAPPPGSDASRVVAERLQSIRTRACFGRAFSEPPTLVLAGPPNSGKSTLANRLLQSDRCIVTPEVGTTRDLVRERLSLSGYPFHLVDSAGLRDTVDPVEAAGVKRAREAAAGADIVLLVLDGQDPPSEARVRDMLEEGPQTIVILNKADLGSTIDPRKLEAGLRQPVCCVSALTGSGVADLTELAIFRSPFRGPAIREWAVPFSARQEEYLTLAADCLDEAPARAAGHLRAFLEEPARPARAGVAP